MQDKIEVESKTSLDSISRLATKCPAQDSSPVLCHTLTPATAYKTINEELYLIGTGCRRWDCPECGQLKRFELVRQITRAAPTKFITLTCRHEGTPEGQLVKMKAGLQKMITWIRKKHACEYVRITEDCVDGFPHFHILARVAFINQAELSTKWKQLTQANIVDIRLAHGKSTRYVSKYVGKNLATADARQRYAVSRKFFVPEKKPASQYTDWKHLHESFLESAENLSTDYALRPESRGCWWLDEREPGDELPQEILDMYPTD